MTLVAESVTPDFIKEMSREDLERYADRTTSQLTQVVQTALHWRDANKHQVDSGYIAPFRYTLPELAETIRQAIFWADWPSREHRDIFAEADAIEAPQ